MLIDVRTLPLGQPVAILGLGRTILPAAYRYDNRRFILEWLTDIGREDLRHSLGLTTADDDDALVKKANTRFLEVAGISHRYIFPGSLAELASSAASACLHQARVSVTDIDAIFVGTNTTDSYSVATEVGRILGAPMTASPLDVQVACPTGVAVVKAGWHYVRAGTHRRVLVIGAEKASRLPKRPDNFRTANLFGDAAFAMLLGAAEVDDFVFFDDGSDPTEGKDQYITMTADGFQQDGPAVHKYVGKVVPRVIEQTFRNLRLDPATVDHFFPHQPSAKTIDFFLGVIAKRCPSLRAVVHRNVEEMGNTSAACTGWMLSRALSEGQLQPGQLCVVASFGAGMTWGLYGFTVSKRLVL